MPARAAALPVLRLLVVLLFARRSVTADDDGAPCSAHTDCPPERYCASSKECARCADDGEDICSVCVYMKMAIFRRFSLKR